MLESDLTICGVADDHSTETLDVFSVGVLCYVRTQYGGLVPGVFLGTSRPPPCPCLS